MKKFRQAMEIAATSEMAKLVRTNQQHAVESIILTCEQISVQTNEELEKEIAAFRKAWKESMKTGFVDKVYTYFSLLRPEFRTQRRKLKVQYDKLSREFYQAQIDKKTTAYAGMGVEFQGMAQGFEELGDLYHASQAWLSYALTQDDSLRGDDADLRAAWRGYDGCVQNRLKIELKDFRYGEVTQRLEYLEKAGYGGSAEEGGAPVSADAELGSAVVVPLQFETMKAVDDIPRPIYNADEIYAAWQSVFLRGKGSTAKFGAMERSPAVIREGDSEIKVDVDFDGEGDVEIPLTGKITPVTIELGEGASKRPWSFFATIGDQRDTYQGFDMNLGPDDTQMNIYVLGAGTMTGVIGETPVRVIDDNMDGIYGSPPKDWAFMGIRDGDYQHDMDSIVVGSEKRARPWSEFQQIGDSWYKLESLDSGTRLKATPATLRTGELKLKYKGPDLQWAVIRGTDKYENCYFDLLQNGKKAIEVPIGRYKLYAGYVAEGKRRALMKALMLGTDRTGTWQVLEGEETEVELGQPFGFDYQVVEGDEVVKVLGLTVVVTGKAGERYERLWNCAVRPEASARKAGSKRGSKPEKMGVVTGQGDIDNHGWEYAWFPLNIELPKKKGEDGYQVQLVEKKNKLFGKIESEWKP